MIDPNSVPPVDSDEWLTHFIFGGNIKPSDQSIRPRALMPRNRELSVTRHLHATDDEVWNVGRDIVRNAKQPMKLGGKAEFQALHCRNITLDVHAAPLPNNPNHANIVNWPEDKNEQMELAIELARVARLVLYASQDS